MIFKKKPSRKIPGFLVWVDIETTGLNPDFDDILEIAIIVTDYKLNELAVFHTYVTLPDISKCSREVVKMHKASGLFEAMVGLEDSSLPEVESALIAFIYQLAQTHAVDLVRHKPKFAGSSVRFDIAFLQAKFPAFASLFHYRILDVSSLIIANQIRDASWIDDTPKALPLHRAESDIRNSLNFTKRNYLPKRRFFR